MTSQQNSADTPPEFIREWLKASGNFVEEMTSAWGAVTSDLPGAAGRLHEQMLDSTREAMGMAFEGAAAFGDFVKEKHGGSPSDYGEILGTLHRFVDGFREQMEDIRKKMEAGIPLGGLMENFDFSALGIKPEMAQTWASVYEKEFQKVFQMPQIGLGREYQQRMFTALDKFNVFHVAAIEFFSFLYLPIERTFKLMKEDMEIMVAEGRMPDDVEAYYALWLKKLEGHYMELFKSSEYTSVLSKALESMADFRKSRDAIVEDALQSMPIPSRSEMDELYREVHVLKRRIRELEKRS